MQREKVCNINVEKLRIIAMLMIVCGHAIGHGGIENALAIGGGYTYYLVKILRITCTLGTNIFVIISGYFLSVSQFSCKKLFVLWLQVLFFSVTIYLLTVWGGETFVISTFVKSFFPISFNQYWFVRVYIYMYLCSPFLNILSKHLTQRGYLLFLGLGILLMVIPASIPMISVFNPEHGNGVLWFFMLYFTGAYLRRFPLKFRVITQVLSVIFLLLLAFFSEIIIALLGNVFGVVGMGTHRLTTFDAFPIYFMAVLVFNIAICIKDSNAEHGTMGRICLFFSASSFSVYLIHEHPSFRIMLWNYLELPKYVNHPLFIVGLVFPVIVIYVLCTVFDVLTWRGIKRLLRHIKTQRIDGLIYKLLESDS